MSYVELKPILFSNFVQKMFFLRLNKLDNVLYQAKDMLAIKYNVEQYKTIFNNKMRKSMGKHNASFFIISSRQFAYMTRRLLKFGFELSDVKVASTLNKRLITPLEFIEDNYSEYSLKDLNNFFDSFNSGRVNKVILRKNSEQISIKINGVIACSNIPDTETKEILKLLREAYDDSQK